jgi:hypothetical protein
MVRLERALDVCLERLKARCSKLCPEGDMSETDDVDSLASGSYGRISMNIPSFSRSRVVRFGGEEKEVESLLRRLTKSEEENRTLRRKVDDLQNLLGQSGDRKCVDEKKSEDSDPKTELSEGGVWNLVRRLNFDDDPSPGQEPS